jgi:hypothetical protein
VDAFFAKVTAFMEETDWVQAYFAFGCSLLHRLLSFADVLFIGVLPDMSGVNPANQLMGSNGKPTALGQKYLNPWTSERPRPRAARLLWVFGHGLPYTRPTHFFTPMYFWPTFFHTFLFVCRELLDIGILLVQLRALIVMVLNIQFSFPLHQLQWCFIEFAMSLRSYELDVLNFRKAQAVTLFGDVLKLAMQYDAMHREYTQCTVFSMRQVSQTRREASLDPWFHQIQWNSWFRERRISFRNARHRDMEYFPPQCFGN